MDRCTKRPTVGKASSMRVCSETCAQAGSSAVFFQTKGLGSPFQCSVHSSIASVRGVSPVSWCRSPLTSPWC
jgi:hypothetical protein